MKLSRGAAVAVGARSFRLRAKSSIGETLAQNSAADYNFKNDGGTDVSRDESWAPCQVCGDSNCGQRPVPDLPVLSFWEIDRLLQNGVLTPTGKEGVLLVVQPEKLRRRKRCSPE